MVAVAVLVALFLTIGFIVVASAFAGHRKPGNEPPARESNVLLYIGVAFVTIGIGLGIPALILVANAKHADKKAVGGVHLTASEAQGREMFAQNCATCHTLRAANAVGKIGPNLDALQPPAALVLNAIQLGRARGSGNMPAGLLTGGDAKDVAAYIAAVAGRGEGVQSQSGTASTPTTPTTSTPTATTGTPSASTAGKAVFTQNCASCHTLKAAGATGQVGPDLDQLKPSASIVTTQVNNGGAAMPAFKGRLSAAQIAAVAQYVSSVAGG
jgi:cytochrome c551